MRAKVIGWDGTKWKVTFAQGDLARELSRDALVTVEKLPKSNDFKVTFATKPLEIKESPYVLQDSGLLVFFDKIDKFYSVIQLLPGPRASVAGARFPIGDDLPNSTGVWGAGGN